MRDGDDAFLKKKKRGKREEGLKKKSKQARKVQMSNINLFDMLHVTQNV